MTGPRTITVTKVNRFCWLLRGFGVRELIESIRGRPPVWSVSHRAWVAQEHTALDAIAVAENRGWRVDLVREDDLVRLAGVERAEERGHLF